MGNYRPICDVWLLARPKVKYYGAFPAGFLHRARQLLGVSADDPVLHVCAGHVRQYPMRGLGPNDRTLDLDRNTEPDFVMDVRKGVPCRMGIQHEHETCAVGALVAEKVQARALEPGEHQWPAILIDRPYTAEDAAKYAPGADALPALNALLRSALQRVQVGGRVGVIDYLWPHPGKAGREVAVVAVGTGRNARARWFTVFERI